MTIKHIITTSTLLLALAAPAVAQAPDPPPAPPAPEARPARGAGVGRGIGRGIDPEALYDQARQAIENSQFDRALEELNRVIADVNSRTDAAMYWKAYSQSKLALTEDALRTIQDMGRQFAASSWVKDAKALEVEIRQSLGQAVSADLQPDEELKLLALRGLMQADPEKGLPIIEKMLAGGASPRVRDRALFVLSQSRSARAHDIMINTAKNNANPELQRTAIRYIGMMRGSDDRETLAGIYKAATDPSTKRAILQSYFMSANVEKTAEVAKTEKDQELRQAAVRNLGMMNRPGSGASEALVSIYNSDSSTEIRRTIINSLFIQHNAKALVDLARMEKDPSLKKDIVSKLSIMKAPEATEYMLELLK
jgi:hypothetical protein